MRSPGPCGADGEGRQAYGTNPQPSPLADIGHSPSPPLHVDAGSAAAPAARQRPQSAGLCGYMSVSPPPSSPPAEGDVGPSAGARHFFRMPSLAPDPPSSPPPQPLPLVVQRRAARGVAWVL